MVMSFFRKQATGLEHIESQAVTMLGDARHSFDLANTALLSGATADSVAADIRDTDQRINQAEQDLRSELVVHVSVQGTQDIASVLGMILLLKKIERIGDQAKNILDLAESGVSLVDSPDVDELRAEQSEVSRLFLQVGELMTNPEPKPSNAVVERTGELIATYQGRIDELMFSELPGRLVVPKAIYYRYLKRIVANLRGVLGVAIDPLTHIDYHSDDGESESASNMK